MEYREIDDLTKEELQWIGDKLGYIPSAAAHRARRFLYGCQGTLKNYDYDETVNYGDMYIIMEIFQYLAEKGVKIVIKGKYTGATAVLRFYDYYKKQQIGITKDFIKRTLGLDLTDWNKDSITVALAGYNKEDFEKNLKPLMHNGHGGITEIIF